MNDMAKGYKLNMIAILKIGYYKLCYIVYIKTVTSELHFEMGGNQWERLLRS